VFAPPRRVGARAAGQGAGAVEGPEREALVPGAFAVPGRLHNAVGPPAGEDRGDGQTTSGRGVGRGDSERGLSNGHGTLRRGTGRGTSRRGLVGHHEILLKGVGRGSGDGGAVGRRPVERGGWAPHAAFATNRGGRHRDGWGPRGRVRADGAGLRGGRGSARMGAHRTLLVGGATGGRGVAPPASSRSSRYQGPSARLARAAPDGPRTCSPPTLARRRMGPPASRRRRQVRASGGQPDRRGRFHSDGPEPGRRAVAWAWHSERGG
jgi:hypothetical protein